MSSCLVRLTPEPRNADTTAVVAFPGAGASATYFRPWTDAMPRDWSLWAVALPGRGSRFSEPFATSLDALVSEIADAIERVPASRRVVFGHSLGALLAFEVSARLSVSPALFGTAGCASPRPEPFTFAPTTPQADIAFARTMLSQMNSGLDGSVLDEVAELVGPVCRADMDLVQDWVAPETKLDCDVLSFYAEDDIVEPEPWTRATRRRAHTFVLPGNHFTLCTESRHAVLSELDLQLT